MTHEVCESTLRSVMRSSMHPCPGNRLTIGRAVVYYAKAAHTFSAEIKCQHCIISSVDITEKKYNFYKKDNSNKNEVYRICRFQKAFDNYKWKCQHFSYWIRLMQSFQQSVRKCYSIERIIVYIGWYNHMITQYTNDITLLMSYS